MRRALAAALLLLAAILPARAQADCASRLDWIDARLARTAHRARVWSWTWGITLGASTVGSLVAVPLVADEERPDWYVSAFTSGVGLLPLVIAPLDVMHDSDVLRAKLEALPAGADRCPLLVEAETMLVRDAEGEALGRVWWNHGLNVVLNGGAGLFLGLVYDRWQSGLLTAVVGIGVGELMIFTQPVDTLDDLREYRTGAISLTVQPVANPEQFCVILAGSW